LLFRQFRLVDDERIFSFVNASSALAARKEHERTALIIGATGGIGSETAAPARRRLDRTRLTRDPSVPRRRCAARGVEWLKGDA